MWSVRMHNLNKHLKIRLASLRTKCTLQYILGSSGEKIEGNKRKESTLWVPPHIRASHLSTVLSPPIDVPKWIQKKNIKEVLVLVQKPPLPTEGWKKPSRKQCVGKILLECKTEFRLQPMFHKAIDSLWHSTVNIPSKVVRLRKVAASLSD